MTAKHSFQISFLLSITIVCVVSANVPTTIAAEQADDSFHDILALAGLGQEALATLSTDADYDHDA